MRSTEIKKIVQKYAQKLKEENFSFSGIYLFGSQVKNKATKWSDIDIAVISDQLMKKPGKSNLLLWKFRRDIDLRLEPHGFTTKEFENLNDPMVYEIRTTGIRIA